jgi:hypothetical protein
LASSAISVYGPSGEPFVETKTPARFVFPASGSGARSLAGDWTSAYRREPSEEYAKVERPMSAAAIPSTSSLCQLPARPDLSEK